MAKRLNTNVFYWKHGSKYVIICNKYWNTSNEQPKQHVVPNPFWTATLVRKGKTIEFSTVTVHKVHKNIRTMDFMKFTNHLPLSTML